MKRIRVFAFLAVLALLTLTLAACGKTEFGITGNTEKWMMVTAEKADKDDYVMAGSLEVADGEQIVITSELTKGSVRVEIVEVPEEQSIDELPQMGGEAILTANLGPGDGAAATMSAGTYMVRAICLEKATGDVQIEVKPAA